MDAFEWNVTWMVIELGPGCTVTLLVKELFSMPSLVLFG